MTLTVVRPVENDYSISSKFGLRVLNGKSEMHKGIDFRVPVGTPVHAMIEGKVYRAGWENDFDPKQGFGLRVMQSAKVDGLAFWFFYGHLRDVRVKVGDILKPGDLVGYSGNTGRTTGPHLHVGARQSDTNEWFDMEFMPFGKSNG